MFLKDLIKPSIKWFIYDDKPNYFSAIKIDEVNIFDGISEKYAKIKGKHLLIRKDYFSCDDDESIFYEYAYHIKNGIVLSQKEFENKYLDKICKQLKNQIS
ncbi:MAG: hypothetical protein J1F35_06330 [Erysipelotrichales bacterium]|nr:hypothetical protein [Erysipelotrichales bacterium]